jgi:PadR family transcriptional regulator
MTLATLQVLSVLVDEPLARHYGLELSKQAGLKPGTIYPILGRLEQARWVTSAWEDIDPTVVGRPQRRYYQLNPDGAQAARRALQKAQRSLARGARGIPEPGSSPA